MQNKRVMETSELHYKVHCTVRATTAAAVSQLLTNPTPAITQYITLQLF